MDGLLDFIKTPEGQGLLSAAFGGLAGAKRGTPWNNIGKAGVAGLIGYSTGQDRLLKEQQEKQQQQVRDMQIKEMQQKMADAEALRNFDFGQFYQTPRHQALSQGGGPTLANAASIGNYQPKLDMQGLVTSMMSSQSPALKQKGLEMLTKEDTPISLAEGAKLVTKGGREIAANPKAPDVKNGYLIPDGKGGWKIDTDLFAAAERLKRAGATSVNMPVSFKQESEEAKTVGKGFGDMYVDLQKGDLAAAGKIARFDRMGQLLEGVQTGKLTPAGTEIAAYAKSIGLNIDPNIGNKQAATALSNELALQARNPAGGAGMPGALSDSDRKFLTETVPGLGKDAESNRLLLETGKKLAQRDRDAARLARAYRKKHGQLNEGFYEELAAFAEKNPLFPVNSASNVIDQADAILKGGR